ncbi:adenylosuccinate lyase [Rhodobacterales bacterium HKCCE4037]|nr:adenylosuccinate lyase [Rhodobacterales bacterium HKCCE4037]
MFFEKLDRSADLVKGMADRTGTDLSNPQTAQQFKRMVLACTGCVGHDACAHLQAENDTLDAAPVYCRNAEHFRT